MSFALWLPLFVVCVLGAMSPGPSLAMVMRNTLNGGRLNGVVAAFSHALGIAIYAGLCVAGLAAVIMHTPWLHTVISIVGAIYLINLAIQALLATGGGKLNTQDAPSMRLMQSVREGLFVALGNPKVIVFLLALLSQFMTAEMSDTARWIIVLTAALVDFFWYFLMALVLSQSRVLPWLKQREAWINRLMGVVLLLLAIRVIVGLF